MSGLLAGKVWQSNLDAHLKPLAAALADIANDDGTSIHPSVEYIAWLLGKDVRSVQRGIRELKTAGVLVAVRNQKGGRNLTVHYRMIEGGLPKRKPWADREKGDTVPPFQKGDAANTKGCHSEHERVTPVSPDPLVDPLDTRHGSRARGYKQPPKPREEKFLYPPPEFQVTDTLYLWLAEMCFAFTDTELVDATNAWRESRASKPNHFARTLAMWQADWQKFIRAYWQIRQRDKARGNGNGKYEQPYTGPVKSTPDLAKENCPDCRGLGTTYKKINGVEYAFTCKHQGQGATA